MKKLILGLLVFLMMGIGSYAQPVSDNAIIPMAITVQSIMRLNIKSGGTMEFVFNKISDLTAGIANSAAYDTNFDISASQDWDLNIGTDATEFISESGATIDLDVITLQIVDGGAATRLAGAVVTSPFSAAYAVLASGALLANATGNAGTAADNEFVINWQCGVAPGATLLSQGAQAGRYTVNVYLSLVAD
jgi:hypothetical protein